MINDAIDRPSLFSSRYKKISLAIFATTLSLNSATSSAAENGPIGLEEVIVTAQKREQSSQDVPAALTAISSQGLKEQGIGDLIDMSGIAPNLVISRAMDTPSIFIRGVGSQFFDSGADGSVAVHIDGVYASRPRSLVSGFYDLERVEILRGPQGDLYGRNATGGSVNLITRKPTEEFEAIGRVNIGNYNRTEFEGAVSGALIEERLSGRLSFISNERDGFTDNIATGNEVDDLSEYGVRGQLNLQATDSLSFLLSVDHYKADDNAYGWHNFGAGRDDVELTGVAFGGTAANDPYREISAEVDPTRYLKLDNAALTITADLNENWTFKSLTGYRDYEVSSSTEVDGTNLPFGNLYRDEKSEQFSEELQLNFSSDDTNIVLGAFYMTEDIYGYTLVPLDLPFLPPGNVVEPEGDLETDAWAIFGRLDYRLNEKIELSLGMRYSEEKRTIDSTKAVPFVPVRLVNQDEEEWDAFSPRASINYHFSDDVMGYFTISEGFKSGGFVVGLNPAVDPEEVLAYETGVKAEFFDRRLQLNLAGFIYKFDDLQVNQIDGTTVIIENAASADINGIEAEFTGYLTDTLKINGSIGWLDATYSDYISVDPARAELGELDLSGNNLPNTPELSAFLNVAQTFLLDDAGSVTLSVNYNWRDDTYFSPYNQKNTFQEAYGELGARLEWMSTSEQYSLALWGKNLTDEDAKTSAAISTDAYGYPILAAVNDPLTFGLELSVRY